MKNGLTDYKASVLRAVAECGHTDLLTSRMNRDDYLNMAILAPYFMK